jgi:2'-5' RNA ligase
MKWEDVLELTPSAPSAGLAWDDVLDFGQEQQSELAPELPAEPQPEQQSSWLPSFPSFFGSPMNRPVSIGQPGTGLTPEQEDNQAAALADVAERSRIADEADRQALLADIANPPLDDPTRLIQLRENLPYPINADVAGNAEVHRQYEDWNEMVTGLPSITWQAKMREAQQAVDSAGTSEERQAAELAMMELQRDLSSHMEWIGEQSKAAKEAGMAPHEWTAQQAADDAGPPLPLPVEVAGAAGEGLWTGLNRTANVLLQRNSENRQQALTDQMQEEVAKLRDEKSLMGQIPGGAWLRGATRQAGTAVGQMAPGIAAGAATGNPAIAYGMMAGQAGIDAYGQAKSEGWDTLPAIGYGLARGTIEGATERIGGLERFVSLGGEKTLRGLAAAAIGEGGEEIAAEVLGNGLDVVTGMNPEAFSDSDYLETFTVGMIAGGIMGSPKLAQFVHDQTVEAARDAGISEDVVKTEQDAKRIAEKARMMAMERVAGNQEAPPAPNVAVPEPAAEPPVTEPQAEPVAPPPLPAESTTGLQELGGDAARGIVDGFYDKIEKSLIDRGRLPTPEQNSSLGKAWRALKGKVEPQVFVSALRTYQPNTPEQWQQFVARLQPQETTNAEQVTEPARPDATSGGGQVEPSPAVGGAGVPAGGQGIEPLAVPGEQVAAPAVDRRGEQVAEVPVERAGDTTAEFEVDGAAPAKKYDYASTQVNLPSPVADKVLSLGKNIPDSDLAADGRENEPHITVKYGLKDDDSVSKVREILSKEPPIKAVLGETSIFEAGNDEQDRGDVVKLGVESDDLARINKLIAKAIPNEDSYPDYQPHVTLAYVKAGEGKKYAGDKSLAGTQIVFDSLSFRTKTGESIEIPLSGKSTEPASAPKPARKTPRTRDEVIANIRDAVAKAHNMSPAKAREVADANIALLENTAKRRGMSLEEYVAERMEPIQSEESSTAWDEKQKGKKKQVVLDKPLEQPAYHGSPHRFDKFTLDKIGTGEGAQAYGWGLYFAGEKEVAKFYREKLSESVTPTDAAIREYFTPGRIVPSYGGKDKVLEFDEKGGLGGGWRVKVQQVEDNEGNPVKDAQPRWHGTRPRASNFREAGVDPGIGGLYKVDLKPTDDELLHWDKPLSEQPKKVQEAFGFDPSNKDRVNALYEKYKALEKEMSRYASLPEGQFFRAKWDDLARQKENLRNAMEDRGAIVRNWAVEYEEPTGSQKYLDLARTTGKEIASKKLLDLGIRGIKYLDGSSRNKGEGSYNYVIFDDADVVIEEILAQEQPSPPRWYMKSRKLVEEKMGPKATSQQVMSMLQKNGVKEEEIEWSGLKELLGTGSGSVTKEQVLAAINNGVQVEEKVLGTNDVDVQNAIASLLERNIEVDEGMMGEAELSRNGEILDYSDLSPEEQQLVDILDKHDRASTKFSNYTLPGGKNYRELLITMQRKRASVDTTGWRAEHYKSPHFDESNILAHIRFNERTDADGKKVLFIEEIQSDWHQAGRRKGYGPVRQYQAYYRSKQIDGRPILVPVGYGATKEEALDSASDWNGVPGVTVEVREIPLPSDEQGVPNAPFKKTWPMLAMKRAIQWASENGFDRVAWTTGEQQAERYDLSKQVDRIDTDRHNGTTDISVIKGNEVVLKRDGLTDNELADIVGKELAEKIVNQKNRLGTYEGLDLKIGGEGMKSFYDQMLPSEVNKFIKKFGAKVDQTGWLATELNKPFSHQGGDYPYRIMLGDEELNAHQTMEGAELEVASMKEANPRYANLEIVVDEELLKNRTSKKEVHSFDITPAMRESALQDGQPLFQKIDTSGIDPSTMAANRRGQVSINPRTGRSTITLFENAQDASTLFHELSHDYLASLLVSENPQDQRDLRIIEREIGVKDGKWTRENHEHWARANERYMFEGKFKSEALRDVLRKFRDWFREIYKKIRNSPLDVKISPKLREVLDRLYMTVEEIADQHAQQLAAKEEKKRQSALPSHHKRIASLAKNERIGQEDADYLRSLDETTGNSLIDYAEDEVTRGDKNGFISSLIEQLDSLVPAKERQAIRQQLLRLGGRGNEDRVDVDTMTDAITRFNDHLGRDEYPLVKAEAQSLGDGDVENGLRQLLAMSNREIKDRHGWVTIDKALSDVVEQFKDSIDKAVQQTKEQSSTGEFAFEDGDEFRSNEPEEEFQLRNDPERRVAGKFQSSEKTAQKGFLSDDLEGQRNFIDEGWAKVPDVAEFDDAEGDDSFDPSEFEDDDSFVGGAGDAGVRANAGLQPLPPIPRLTPKGQHEIIAEIGKAIGTPIAFGGMGPSAFGGFFRRFTHRGGKLGRGSNLIVSRLANDIPVVTHEAGHSLDGLFEFSKYKPISSELMMLGDPATPGSRSSMTKSKSQAYQRREGVAEFFRYWFTDPKHAARMAPNTLAHVEDVLDANKEIGDALRQIQKDVLVWRTSPAQARLRSHIVSGEQNKRRLTHDQLTRDLVDDLHFTKIATEHVKKQLPNLPPSEQTYMMARLLRGSYGIANAFLTNGQAKFKNKQVKPGTSLKHILAPVSNRLDEFTDWIVAVRAKELHSQDRETGLLDADIDETINNYANDKQFHDVFDKLKGWNDAILQYAVDAGLVSDMAADSMRQMNQDYVPFHRMFEIAAGVNPSEGEQGVGRGLNLGKPGSMMALKGSPRPIVNPLETMVRNAYAVLTAAEKAAVHGTIRNIANSDNGGKYVRKIASPIKKEQFNFKEIREQLENLGADVDMIDDFDRLAVFVRTQQAPHGRNIIRIMENGEYQFYQVLDNDLYDTFHALDVEQANMVVDLIARGTGDILRAGVTLNPAYVLANVIRDNVGAPVINKYRGSLLPAVLPFEPMAAGLMTIIGHHMGIQKYSKIYGEFQISGADNAIEAAFFDRNKTKKYLQERIAKGESITTSLLRTLNPFAILRAVSNVAEQTTRVGEYQIAYRALRKKGMPKGEARRMAAFEARDRQDFAKGGAITKSARRLFPFWNAALQGTVRTKQVFQKHPVRTTLQGLAWITIPTMTLLAYNWDDDDYWARPEWERDLFWLIPWGLDSGGHTRFIKLPKPPLLGQLFGTSFERMAGSIKNDKSKAAEASRWVKDFIQEQSLSVVPASGPLHTMYELMSPQGWSAFRRREIVPDSLADLAPQEQWTDQTSEVAKRLGGVLGWSPMKVDYFIEQTTGGVGQAVKDESDRIYDWLTDQPERRSQTRGTLRKRFLTNDLAVSNEYSAKFYGYMKEMQQIRAGSRRHGTDPGMSIVMLPEFEKMSSEIAGLMSRSRTENDKAKRTAMLEEAMQITRNTVESYEKNPSPPEAVQAYAFKQAEYAVRGLRNPVQAKTETDTDFSRRLAAYEVRRSAADNWIRSHIDDQNVRSAIKESLKPKYFPDKGSPRYAERLKLRNEWLKLSRTWD